MTKLPMRVSPCFVTVVTFALASFYSSSNVDAFVTQPSSAITSRSAFSVNVNIPQSSSSSSSLGMMGFGKRQEGYTSPFSVSKAKENKSNSLFGTKSSIGQGNNNNRKSIFSVIPAIILKLRRSLTIIIASAFLFLGPVSHPPLTHQPMAHASTLTMSPKSQKKLDKIVDNYVQRHMFDDDKFDPLESTYREIISDSSTGTYPNALSSIASNLGTTQTTSSSVSAEQNTGSNDGAMKAMLKLVNTLETKYNIPRSILVPALALACFGVPSAIIGMGLLSFSFSQRSMTERMAIERYGESDLNAEEKPIEEDEEDDYDYESGEYEDDDDDDDDDDDVSNSTLIKT
jgi:hypothetical protein